VEMSALVRTRNDVWDLLLDLKVVHLRILLWWVKHVRGKFDGIVRRDIAQR